MLTIDTLMNIICTEAIEFGGQQEVPDQKHGAAQNYHAQKREARGQTDLNHSSPNIDGTEPTLIYNLEVIVDANGHWQWVD